MLLSKMECNPSTEQVYRNRLQLHPLYFNGDKMEKYIKNPAQVKYIGSSSESFTNGKIYSAYFLEYWQGKRDSLHVMDNSGKITDFNPFEDFEILEDVDHVLNAYEATVKCVTHKYDSDLFDLTYGNVYKAIGRDKDGLYLIMDDSHDCYFYPSDCFEIISDEHDLLSHRSIYYSFNNCED